MRFSERYGHKEPIPFLQPDEVTNELRNRIWNVLYTTYFDNIGALANYSPPFHKLSMHLRDSYFKIPVDDRDLDPKIELQMIKDHYLALNFPEFYDFLETMAVPTVARFRRFREDVFTEHCNQVFEEGKAAYRFVENWITPIINEEERAATCDAVRSDEAGRHISEAIALYRNRSKPDYRNSVKESISAVEATYRRLTGEKPKNIKTAITILENQGIKLPASLREGFSAIYGWTSGPDGIRHALMKDAREITEPQARLMLVMCSAYVNYLLCLRGTKPK